MSIFVNSTAEKCCQRLFEVTPMISRKSSSDQKSKVAEYILPIIFSCLIIFLAVKINFLLLIALPSVYCFNLFFKKLKQNNEIANFEKDYPAFLIALSSSVKCGIDPVVAVIKAQELFDSNSVISRAISDFEKNISSEVTEQEAIQKFANNINHPDIVLFREAFALARSQGASLSLCLQRIARVVRTRQSFRRKAKAAVAMQKLSAFGILIAVVVMFVVQLISSYQSLVKAWSSPIGYKLLIFSLILISAGIFGIIRTTSWRDQR